MYLRIVSVCSKYPQMLFLDSYLWNNFDCSVDMLLKPFIFSNLIILSLMDVRTVHILDLKGLYPGGCSISSLMKLSIYLSV